MRYAQALVQAGKADEALTVVRTVLQTKPPPAPDIARGLTEVASTAATYQARGALEVLASLVPLVAAAEQTAVHAALGRAYETAADHRAAAAAYLSAAAGAAAPESDRDALRARQDAARVLLHAGLRQDARTIYAWLARNAKDAAVRELAAGMLRTLP